MTQHPRETIGLKIRAIRRARGLSQQAFADELEFDRTYIGSLERGERNLTLDTVVALAERLGIDVLELLVPPSPLSIDLTADKRRGGMPHDTPPRRD